MAQSFGSVLDPYRRLKEPLGVKGIRQTVIVTNNPSTIDQNEILTVRFPNLGKNDVIVPGTVRLSFKLELESGSDENRTLAYNVGRAIVRKITVKLEGREVMSLNNADVFLVYADNWLTDNEKKNRVFQGIQSDNGIKVRIGAGDKADNKKDNAVNVAFGNKFCIPLDFELINSHPPFYQGALRDRLSYDLTFNSYDRVMLSQDPEAKYKVSGISLEFDVVNHPELARLIENQYSSKLPIYYERVLNHSTLSKSQADPIWNINLNTPARSMKGILMLFEEPKDSYERQIEKFYNPLINRVYCTIEGQPNQIFASGMLPYQHYDEARKYFTGGRLKDPTSDLVAKDLHLHGVGVEDFLTNKYALWLDLRTTDDNKLHGSGRRIENGSEGITIQIEKEVGSSSKSVKIYVFVVSDAQLNISESRLQDIVY